MKKKIIEFLLCYGLIPFISSFIGFLLAMFGLGDFNIIVVPLVAIIIYILLRKKLQNSFWMIGAIVLILVLTFTVMMFISSGNVEGVLMSYFNYLILPFGPFLLIYALMAKNVELYLIVLITYTLLFVASAIITKKSFKKLLIVLVVILLGVGVDSYLYLNHFKLPLCI